MIGEKVIVYHPESDCFVAVGTITEEFETGDICFKVEGEVSAEITINDMSECGVISEDQPEYAQAMKDFLSTKVDAKPTVMIFGSRSIRQIPQIAIASLNKIMELGFNVIIGDAPGVDAVVQRYLRLKDYKNVTVYYAMFDGVGNPRNSSGFKTVGVPGNYSQRDAEMRRVVDYKYGLAIWDGVSRGTKTSIEIMKCCKVITVK